MAELDDFKTEISDKTDNTQKSYLTQYKKLYKLLGKPIGESSQKKVIEVIMDNIANINGQQALYNVAILIRRMNHLSTSELESHRERNKKSIVAHVKEKNAELSESLPTYDDLLEFMEYLYNKTDYLGFVINYLLINYHVRNEDINAIIVDKKREVDKESDNNYIWLAPQKVVFIRQNYKTSDKYGTKEHTINDKRFMTAIRKVKEKAVSNGMEPRLVPDDKQTGYYIQKHTLKQLGEGKYVKIIINHYRDEIDKLKEIGMNRGTSYATLLSNYDIEMK